MKLWIINHYAAVPTQPGGTRHYGLAAELNRLGHETVLIAANFNHDTRSYTDLQPGTVSHQNVEGVPIVWLPVPSHGGYARRLWNMFVFAWRVRFAKAVRQLPRPDLIFGSTLTLFAAFASLRMARRLRIPFVLEVRDVWPQTLIDFGVSRYHPLVLLFGALERYLYRESDAIVTLLPGSVKHIRTRGAQSKPVVWLPNGVDLKLMQQPTHRRPKPTFDVVYAGSHSIGDALESVIQAAAIIEKQGRNNIRFRLIGNGPSKLSLKRQVEQMGLCNVTFEAPVAKQEVYIALAQADILLATLQAVGVYRFGISLNKLYDYMAVARPVIFAGLAFNDPVSDACCGITIPPEDPQALATAIRQIARMSPEQRWEMGQRGRRYVEEHHDFSKLAVKLERVLQDALDGYHRQVAIPVGQVSSKTTHAATLSNVVKRAFDLLACAAASTILWPLLLVIATFIKMRMGSPVLFCQLRPGESARPFTLFKFRTMNDKRDDAGRLLPDAERLTPIGRFLRATSLDELPQLWNVLRGDMSLVGPRPLLMEYLRRYTSEQARRHEVRPGITGWAQVNGRNALSWEEKFSLDLWYVEHWCLRPGFEYPCVDGMARSKTKRNI